MVKTIRVYLPEDSEGKNVEILNPMHLRRKEMRMFDRKDGESDSQYGDRFLQSIIVSGNLTAEDGRPLNYPLNDADMDELTIYHTVAVSKAFEEAMGDVAPKN